MKTITMFIMETCPHCRAALQWMNDLIANNEKYKALTINIIDERKQPEVANKLSYYYVPTYYVDDEKVHEGSASEAAVKKVLDYALSQ